MFNETLTLYVRCQPPTSQCDSVILSWWVNTGVTYDHEQFLTRRTSTQRCSLGTASARRRLTNPLLPSPVWAWLISTSRLKQPERINKHWLSCGESGSGSHKRIYCESWRHWAFLRTTRALPSRVSLSLSPQSEYERGSPQTVIRLTEMGCWVLIWESRRAGSVQEHHGRVQSGECGGLLRG